MSEGESSPEVTPHDPRRGPRLVRHQEALVGALKVHVRLLREYAKRAFDEADQDYFGEVAGKLRVLVIERGHNKPLLLGLMDHFGVDMTVTLDGPPVRPPTGVPGAGDRVTLREYLNLMAIALRVPSRGLVSMTNADLITAWAQQTGASHEDWAIQEELAHALYGGLYILGLPAAAYTLKIITDTVLTFAERFLVAAASDSD